LAPNKNHTTDHPNTTHQYSQSIYAMIVTGTSASVGIEAIIVVGRTKTRNVAVFAAG
jgi:hypothetical protein